MTADQQVPARLRRKRAEQAPRAVLAACAGTWTAAGIMHLTGVSWLDVSLGAAAVAGAAYGKGSRDAAAGLLLAGGWSALAARLGPLADPGLFCPVTQAWAVLSFCGWRRARRHPAVTAARDRRLAAADWLARRARWGLPGSHLLDFQPTRLGEWYLADVKGTGKRASQIAGSSAAELIAEDLDLPRGRVRVTAHRLAGRIEISVRRIDPWAKPVPHPVLAEVPGIDLSGAYSIRQPAVIGQDPETGKPLAVLLCGPGGGRNVNVVATIEAGKTVLLACLSERVTKAPDALQIRVNLSIKGDAERYLWGPACHLTAFGPGQKTRALRVLRVIAKIVQWRADRPKASANWAPSPGDPHIVLIIDEIDSLTAIPACRQVLEHLASKGREYGVTIVRAGQRGTAEWTGGGNVRAVDGVFCVGKVNRSAEAMHAAGDLGLRLPDMSTYGEGAAGVWAVAELDGRHEAGRTFNLSEPDDIRKIVAERAWTQPELQPELKAFLGESYENLLSTDVFARWARDQQQHAVIARPRPDMPPGPAPDGADPRNPPHAVALLVRDGAVPADDETAGTPAKALETEERGSLAAYDAEAEDALPDDLRARWVQQGRKLDEIRGDLAAAAAAPVPDVPHEEQVAQANARWRDLAEKTMIPDGKRGLLLALVGGGTTISAVAEALGVSSWTARTYLARLGFEGVADLDGKGRGARWVLVKPSPPEEGDGS